MAVPHCRTLLLKISAYRKAPHTGAVLKGFGLMLDHARACGKEVEEMNCYVLTKIPNSHSPVLLTVWRKFKKQVEHGKKDC